MKDDLQLIVILALSHILQLLAGQLISTNILPLLPILSVIYYCLHKQISHTTLLLSGFLTDILFGSLIGQHALVFLLLNQFFSQYGGQKIRHLHIVSQSMIIFILVLIYWVSIVWLMHFYQPFNYQASFWVVPSTALSWLPLSYFSEKN